MPLVRSIVSIGHRDELAMPGPPIQARPPDARLWPQTQTQQHPSLPTPPHHSARCAAAPSTNLAAVPRRCAAAQRAGERSLRGVAERLQERMAARTPAAAVAREAIRVATYNVLGQCYTRSSLFPASPRACLRQKPRLAAVAAEVAGAEADFCCVQELERSFLDGVLAPTLSEHGLAALYKQRTGVRKSKPDGSAIIYRVSKWAPRKSAPVMELEFNDLAPEDADAEHTLVRDCVGLVAAFDAVGEEDGGQEGSAWGSLVVATAHLFWDPQHADVKEKQAKFLVERAQAYAEEHLGERAHRLVVGGDFNSLPESALIEQIQASGLKSAYSPWPEVCDKGLEFRFWGTPHPKERSLG